MPADEVNIFEKVETLVGVAECLHIRAVELLGFLAEMPGTARTKDL